MTRPPYRYVPVRKSLSDILNVGTGFFPALPRVPFEKVAASIRSESRSDDEWQANLRVAQGLYGYAEAMRLEGRRYEIFPLTLAAGVKVAFWHSLVIVKDREPFVPFVDPRRSSTRLTSQAQRFVFSVMHERIRVPDPDFADVRLAIFQFATPPEGSRVPIMRTDEGVVLFTPDELEEMVRETYEIWTEVYTERVRSEPLKREASGFGF
jgi:hypothetical protein